MFLPSPRLFVGFTIYVLFDLLNGISDRVTGALRLEAFETGQKSVDNELLLFLDLFLIFGLGVFDGLDLAIVLLFKLRKPLVNISLKFVDGLILLLLVMDEAKQRPSTTEYDAQRRQHLAQCDDSVYFYVHIAYPLCCQIQRIDRRLQSAWRRRTYRA